MSKWVKLPDDAQVTLGKESFESYHGYKDKIIIGILIFVIFMLVGRCGSADDTKTNQPRPTHSVSTSVRPSN